MNGINRAMPSDSTKLLVDLREEGSRARWRGQKWKIFFPAKKAVDVRWDVVAGPSRPPPLLIKTIPYII